MFVDVSALLAMLLDEEDARILGARLQASPRRLISPMAVFEASAGVSSVLGLPLGEAEEAVKRFLDLMGIQIMSLPAQIVPLALDALARFGRAARAEAGGGAPALDMADCLAYASARYYRLPLLYKGAKFAATDIEAA